MCLDSHSHYIITYGIRTIWPESGNDLWLKSISQFKTVDFNNNLFYQIYKCRTAVTIICNALGLHFEFWKSPFHMDSCRKMDGLHFTIVKGV